MLLKFEYFFFIYLKNVVGKGKKCWCPAFSPFSFRKYRGKRRKCWTPAFSPFSTMFSKGIFPTIVKNRDCAVNGYQTKDGAFHLHDEFYHEQVMTNYGSMKIILSDNRRDHEVEWFHGHGEYSRIAQMFDQCRPAHFVQVI